MTVSRSGEKKRKEDVGTTRKAHVDEKRSREGGTLDDGRLRKVET